MNSVEQTLSGLEKLIRTIKFEKEKMLPHIIPGIMLFISLPAYASVLYNIYLGNSDILSIWYTRLATIYVGYVLSSAYSSYRIYKLLHKHLVDSGLTSYYWLKKIDDIDSIIKLYKAGLMKRDIASPITAFLITLFSGGLAYPILLFLAEKILRNHAYGEESKFIHRPVTSTIGIEQGLLFIAAVVLTMGLYLVYWSYRIIGIYNRHLDLIHGNHPELPKPQYIVSTYNEENIPILSIGLVFAGIVFYGAIGLLGLPCYLPSTIGYGALLGYIAISYKHTSFLKQVFMTYVFVYLVFLATSAIGFVSAPTYSLLYQRIMEQIAGIKSNDLLTLTLNIFFNNLGISIVAISPLIGATYLGLGLGNSGLMYGIILSVSILKNNYSAIMLPIMPHALLELLAYSVFVVISTRIMHEETRKIIMWLLLGISILLLAAVVESLSVLLQPTS